MAFGDTGPAVVGQLIATPWVPESGPVRINQGYGPTSDTGEPGGHGALHFHPGVDLNYDAGTIVYFPHLSGLSALLHIGLQEGTFHRGVWDSQKRKYAPDPGGYGNHATTITIGNPGRVDVILGHGMAWLQPDGATVRPGDALIKTDNEGNSTGPHLHFELRPVKGGYGSDVDPWPLVTGPSGVVETQGVGGPAAAPQLEKWHGTNGIQDSGQPASGGGPALHQYRETPEAVIGADTGILFENVPRYRVGGPTPPVVEPGPAPGTPNQNTGKNPATTNICGYVAGNCTAYMAELFDCVCNANPRLGNGGQWFANARLNGWPTSTSPKAGWVACFNGGGWSSFGHVGLILSVSPDGKSISLESMNFKGLGVISTNTVQIDASFTGCLQPPCPQVGGSQAQTSANTSGGCPDWYSDPAGFFACQAQQAMTPVATAITSAVSDAEKIVWGSALTAVGAGILGVALWIGVGQIRQSGIGQGLRQAAPRRPLRRPVRRHPEARVARATGGNRAAPAPPQPSVAHSTGTTEANLSAPSSAGRPTRSAMARAGRGPLIVSRPTQRTIRLVRPRVSGTGEPIGPRIAAGRSSTLTPAEARYAAARPDVVKNAFRQAG